MSKLLDEVRNTLRVHHYAMKTEKSYVQWIKRFILFHKKRHPKDMGKLEVEAFLTWLAVKRHVAPSTQNQALQAILFLYRKVLKIELAWLDDVVRAKRPHRIPVVLSRREVATLLAALTGSYQLIGKLLYGSGLRLMECLRLRVIALDLNRQSITVHAGKGGKDRVIPVLTEVQRDVLNRARLLAGFGSLIPSNRNYAQQMRVYEGNTLRAGLSRMHGLRHAYAQNRYEELTGWKAPAVGGPKAKVLTPEQRETDRQARLIISRELGHERAQITAAYCGV